MVTASLSAEEEYATVTVRVSDETPVNRATVAVTMIFSPSLSFSPDSAQYALSPEFVGVVHSLVAMGGSGGYAYERVSGTMALRVNPSSGAVSLVSTLAVGSAETAVFVAKDGIGGSARFSLILQADTATAGEEAMYLIGGGGSKKTQNDIWQSTDGVVWTRVIASVDFSSRNNHQAVSHGGTLWVVGGVGSGGGSDSDIWYSPGRSGVDAGGFHYGVFGAP